MVATGKPFKLELSYIERTGEVSKAKKILEKSGLPWRSRPVSGDIPAMGVHDTRPHLYRQDQFFIGPIASGVQAIEREVARLKGLIEEGVIEL